MSRLTWGPTLTAAPTQRTARCRPGDSVAPSGELDWKWRGRGSRLELCAKPKSHLGECVPSSVLAPRQKAWKCSPCRRMTSREREAFLRDPPLPAASSASPLASLPAAPAPPRPPSPTPRPVRGTEEAPPTPRRTPPSPQVLPSLSPPRGDPSWFQVMITPRRQGRSTVSTGLGAGGAKVDPGFPASWAVGLPLATN